MIETGADSGLIFCPTFRIMKLSKTLIQVYKDIRCYLICFIAILAKEVHLCKFFDRMSTQEDITF